MTFDSLKHAAAVGYGFSAEESNAMCAALDMVEATLAWEGVDPIKANAETLASLGSKLALSVDRFKEAMGMAGCADAT